MDFEEFIALWERDITLIVASHRSYFRYEDGWEAEPEDARQELLIVMYRAWYAWKPSKGEYGKLWWSMWRNLLSDRVRRLNAAKRAARVIALSPDFDVVSPFHMDQPNVIEVGATGTELRLFNDLAGGLYSEAELRLKYGSVFYDNTLARWRGIIRHGGPANRVRTRRSYVLYKQGRKRHGTNTNTSTKG